MLLLARLGFIEGGAAACAFLIFRDDDFALGGWRERRRDRARELIFPTPGDGVLFFLPNGAAIMVLRVRKV